MSSALPPRRPAPPRPSTSPKDTSAGSDPPGGAAAPAPALVALKLTEGTVVAGKYRLERSLSHGAMGSVWVATHLALQTPVAIKFMVLEASAAPSETPPAAPTPESRGRFEREARAAAQVRSANVVQILDYGVDGATPYIAMELLQGEDLSARLKRVGRLSPVDVARLVTAVARALQRAHDAGLVHRDLKPGNIFLAKEGDDEVPKVLDFGVAKPVRPDRPLDEGTHEGTLVGTPSYMSPEQAMGRVGVDHRSDLWSLGVVTFRALTGAKPFPAESLLEVVVQICTSEATRASSLVPDLPPGVDAFFARALAREPADRFQSAKEMSRALAALLHRGDADGDAARLLPSAPSSDDVPVEFDDPDRTLDAAELASRSLASRSAHVRRRWILAAAGMLGVGFVTGLSFLLRNGDAPPSGGATSTAAPSTTLTPSTTPTPSSLPSIDARPPASAPTTAAPDAAPSSVATPIVPTASAPRSTPPRTSRPPPPSKKTRHDLGY